MRKKALVTGGAGFLGSYLCEQLLSQGAVVTCIDNFLTGRPQNVQHLIGDDFSIVEADVRDPFVRDDFDEIWNLACPASPPHYQRDPVGTLLTNVVGMKNALDLAREIGAKLIQASTSEVYGNPELHPQPESYLGAVNTIGPRACYDEGKRAAETLCFDYRRQYGVRVKLARVFNTYGPRMDENDGRVVSNFVVKALKGEPLQVYGSGQQTRSFCYRDDLVDGLFRLMGTAEDITGPVNLGNPTEFTVLDLASMILRLTGSNSRIEYLEPLVDDPQQRCPDISLARTLLDWTPVTSLEEGLHRTIAYFRSGFYAAA